MGKKFREWAMRVRSAWAVLCGHDADLQIRWATLALDIHDRDQEIRQLRQEYDLQREQATRASLTAATVGFEAWARPLVTPLSQLATMRALVPHTPSMRIEDVLKLCDQIEQGLTRSGLSRIGIVGATVAFETRLHQRISGIELQDGDPIILRFVGYRLGETILLKAMVSYQGKASKSLANNEESLT